MIGKIIKIVIIGVIVCLVMKSPYFGKILGVGKSIISSIKL